MIAHLSLRKAALDAAAPAIPGLVFDLCGAAVSSVIIGDDKSRLLANIPT
jgi:hypothetical protein